jgi:hypothetical protein
MPAGRDRKSVHCRRPLIIVSIVAVAAFALLEAGCGGGSSPASSTTAATASTQTGALAFARCMRSHGLPKWPDPTSSGVFDKKALRQTGYSVSQVRAAEDGPCNHLLGGASDAEPAITAAERADYLRAAECMRSHGIAGFPDPTFQDNSVRTNIPSSIDQDAPQFRSAATICTKLIPAGLPYSSSTGP